MLPFILAQTLQMYFLIVCLARCIATACWGVCGTHSQGGNHSGSLSVAQILAGLQLSNLLNEERDRPSHGCISDTSCLQQGFGRWICDEHPRLAEDIWILNCRAGRTPLSSILISNRALIFEFLQIHSYVKV